MGLPPFIITAIATGICFMVLVSELTFVKFTLCAAAITVVIIVSNYVYDKSILNRFFDQQFPDQITNDTY